MGSSTLGTPRWKPPTWSMTWKPACSSSQKRGACKRALCAEAGTLEGDRGRAGRLADQLAQVKRMHQWVMEVEHLLDESLAQPGEAVSNATMGSRLDAWRARVAPQLTDGTLSELEREGLSEVLQLLSNQPPHLARAYC